jgi:putative membrane protein insertion efficiency factor
MLPVLLYRLCVSPWKPPTCRFRPTCSRYALDALRRHGAVRGGWLAVRRLCRCHPFCEPGFDPVPPAREQPQRAARGRQT